MTKSGILRICSIACYKVFKRQPFLSKSCSNGSTTDLKVTASLRVASKPRRAPTIMSCFWRRPCSNEVKINADAARGNPGKGDVGVVGGGLALMR
ncbi:hypothetical protein GIB67_038919 [Kingdonia uniflora]|uniref:Uncharacterized protein n=1 Tax=Kingdonia uniflora TaxID=39325 RepID=A0A7J7LQJ2_9MAGN|nr:hypothetical protein GIB67_038919 [Kingdonia uniflora]